MLESGVDLLGRLLLDRHQRRSQARSQSCRGAKARISRRRDWVPGTTPCGAASGDPATRAPCSSRRSGSPSGSPRTTRGATLDVTEMQPAPPWALKPSAEASSPESWMKSLPQARRCSVTRSTLPVASLTPTMLRKSLRKSSHRLRQEIDDGAWWNVVDDDRQPGGGSDGSKVGIEPALVRLVIIWRHDQNRVSADLLGMLRKSDGLVRCCWNRRPR